MNSVVRTATIGPEPISLAYMKNALKVPLSVVVDDIKISRLIKAARMQCELLSNSALVRQTWVQYLDRFPGNCSSSGHSGAGYGYGVAGGGWDGTGYNKHGRPHDEIKVKRPPLVSVESLTYIGTDGRYYTLNPGQDFVVDIASKPGRIRPIPYTAWPLTLDTPAAVKIAFTAGYALVDGDPGQTVTSEPETLTQSLPPSWKPLTVQAQYSFVVDPLGNIEVQMNSGSPSTAAGPGQPVWPAIGSTVTDGGCSWKNVGPLRGNWTPGTDYAGFWIVLDFNSNLQMLNTPALVSGTVPPESQQLVGTSPIAWSATRGGLTPDNGIAGAWLCLGPYNAIGNSGLSSPNSPEQQPAVIVDLGLPEQASLAIEYLVQHWYYNREYVTAGPANVIPQTVLDLLGAVTVHDFAPTP